MIATPHTLASRSGADVLRRGGNAVDAAIAAAATIAVVYPHMNGIGGDNFWLVYDAAGRRLRGLAGCGRSAAAATIAWYRARGVTTAIPIRGPLATLTVPGVIDGWWEAHRYSRDVLKSPLRWQELLAPAIAHAAEGFPSSAGQRRWSSRERDLFGPAADPSVRAGLWPRYHPDAIAGDRFVQPEMARTLQAVADGGADEFYRGELGRRVAAALAAAGSPLSFPDFQAHRSDWVEPLTVPYRGGIAASFPPPTQGFAALAILATIEGFDLAGVPTADRLHLIVEATKLAFEDRDRYLTDPDVVPVPVAECLDPARIVRRRAQIDLRKARPVGGTSMPGGTVAIVAGDAQGNAVTVIQSVFHTYGSGLVAGDTGVVMQNRGSFFSLDPAHPNALAPGKRTAHTLIPSMYLVDDRPRFLYGTMGGEAQPQTQAAVLLQLLEGAPPQAAVDAPRWLFGRTWGEPSKSLRIESRFDEEVARDLAARGHDVVVTEPFSEVMGHAQAVAITESGIAAGSDCRADGLAR
jgi:gamma-glutamyltranspeptidase/glutathione hydrolase